MPLSEPQPREERHHRRIEMRGYRRGDGLWDIEGVLRDVKAYDFSSETRGVMPAGTPVHDMWIRLTVDETMLVQDVEVAMDANPHTACPAILPAFNKLKGLRIAPGWNRKVRELLGGVRGCTHLVEMLGPLATVAYQSIGVSKVPMPDGGTLGAPADPTRKPKRIDSCHALAADGDVVRKRWPAFYTGPKAS
jgi:hypothetical protein